MNNFSRSTSFNQWALNVESPRFFSIATPIALNVHHSSRLFPVLILIGALISFIIVLGGGYMYILPSLSQAFLGYGVLKFNNSSNVWNVFDGSWVIVEGEKKRKIKGIVLGIGFDLESHVSIISFMFLPFIHHFIMSFIILILSVCFKNIKTKILKISVFWNIIGNLRQQNL